jgi:hypothetical protein
MRKELQKRMREVCNRVGDELVELILEQVAHFQTQANEAFEVALSAFESDLSVTDGAARRHDVRTNGRVAGSRAQRRSGVDSPTETKRERDEATTRSSEIDAASSAGDATSHGRRRGACSPQVNPALQQGKDLPPSTSSKTRVCGCSARGPHRKTCSLPNVSTSPASGSPAKHSPQRSPAPSPISRPSAGPLASVQARAAAQAESKPVGRLPSKPLAPSAPITFGASNKNDRFAQIESAAERREALKRDRGERARRFIRKDGVKPTKEPVAPMSADAEAEVSEREPALPSAVRASFQF